MIIKKTGSYLNLHFNYSKHWYKYYMSNSTLGYYENY